MTQTYPKKGYANREQNISKLFITAIYATPQGITVDVHMTPLGESHLSDPTDYKARIYTPGISINPTSRNLPVSNLKTEEAMGTSTPDNDYAFSENLFQNLLDRNSNVTRCSILYKGNGRKCIFFTQTWNDVLMQKP